MPEVKGNAAEDIEPNRKRHLIRFLYTNQS